MKEKSNKKMMILSFLGIIFVVLGHTTGNQTYFFGNLFPFYSFHMPLFVFISGYFYKQTNETNTKKYIFAQFKKLVIPYFIWNIIYGIILLVIKSFNLVSFGDGFDWYSLFVRPWVDGHQFHLNLAAWFILALFLVKVIYVVFRKIITKFRVYNDYIWLIIFLVICIMTIKCSKGADNAMLPLLRTGFFLFFYQLGVVYRKIENKIRIKTIIKLLGIVLIQFIILKLDSSFSATIVFMNFKSKYAITAIIASLTGIMFWTIISGILEPALKDNKIVNYISNHTKEIMFHHIFWIFAINTIINILVVPLGLSGFNNSIYRITVYYYYTAGVSQVPIIYAFFCVGIPITLHYVYEKCFEKIKNKYIDWKNKNLIKSGKKDCIEIDNLQTK